MLLKKVAFVSSFPPRQYGTARSISNLVENVFNTTARQHKPIVDALTNSAKSYLFAGSEISNLNHLREKLRSGSRSKIENRHDKEVDYELGQYNFA